MITLKESQRIHRAHLKVIEAKEKLWFAAQVHTQEQPRDLPYFRRAVGKAETKWMDLLTKLTPNS